MLTGVGGGLVAALGGVAWRAADQGVFTPETARPGFVPWRDVAEGRHTGPMAVAAAGVLAASPHNTQPWLFRVSPSAIDLHAVPARHLGAFDPYRREMMLGLGCAVENMVQAAGGQGLTAAVLPGSLDTTHVARIALAPGPAVRTALLDAIPRRRTNRGVYDTRRDVEEDRLAELRALATDPATRLLVFGRGTPGAALFGAATVTATAEIVADTEMMAWSHRWTRSSRRAIDRERSGLTLQGAGLDALTELAGTLLPPIDAATEGHYWLAATRDRMVPTAAAFGMILVRDPYDRAQALAAGRLWQRLHLQGTVRGLAMQPLNQIPEMIDRERQLGRAPATATRIAPLLTQADWRPTFGFRLGYPTRLVPASPRRGLDDMIIARSPT